MVRQIHKQHKKDSLGCTCLWVQWDQCNSESRKLSPSQVPSADSLEMQPQRFFAQGSEDYRCYASGQSVFAKDWARHGLGHFMTILEVHEKEGSFIGAAAQ